MGANHISYRHTLITYHTHAHSKHMVSGDATGTHAHMLIYTHTHILFKTVLCHTYIHTRKGEEDSNESSHLTNHRIE